MTSTRYQTARAILESKTAGTLEGHTLDLFTASALVAVYEALSPENRAKVDGMPLDRFISFVWRAVK